MLKKLLIILSLVFTCVAFADEAEDKAEFNRLYAEFNELYANSEDIKPIIGVAEKLYLLTPNIYGKYSQQHAVITYNLAKIIDDWNADTYRTEEIRAGEYYKEYFKILNRIKAIKNDQFFDQYMIFVTNQRVIHAEKLKDRYLNDLIKMASNSPISLDKRSEVEFFVANQRYLKGDYKKAGSLYKLARERYISQKGTFHLLVANAAVGEALVYFNDRRYQDAEELYLQALEIYESLDETDENLLANTHKNLARLYIETENYDESAEHGAKIRELADSPREMLFPIIRVPPYYPGLERQYGQNGLVLLELTVDKEGRTKDIKIQQSTSQSFEESAIKAVEQFRYIPMMENGKRVEVQGVVTQIRFQMGDRKGMRIY